MVTFILSINQQPQKTSTFIFTPYHGLSPALHQSNYYMEKGEMKLQWISCAIIKYCYKMFVRLVSNKLVIGSISSMLVAVLHARSWTESANLYWWEKPGISSLCGSCHQDTFKVVENYWMALEFCIDLTD